MPTYPQSRGHNATTTSRQRMRMCPRAFGVSRRAPVRGVGGRRIPGRLALVSRVYSAVGMAKPNGLVVSSSPSPRRITLRCDPCYPGGSCLRVCSGLAAPGTRGQVVYSERSAPLDGEAFHHDSSKLKCQQDFQRSSSWPNRHISGSLDGPLGPRNEVRVPPSRIARRRRVRRRSSTSSGSYR